MERDELEVSQMQVRRLTKSRTNRVLTGLCGGIGEYLDVDPVLIRLLWLLLPGANLVAYIVGAIIVPDA